MDSLTVVGFATRPSFLAAQPNSAFAVRPTGGGAEKQGGGIQGDVALASPEGNAKREENLAGGTKKRQRETRAAAGLSSVGKYFVAPAFCTEWGRGVPRAKLQRRAGRQPNHSDQTRKTRIRDIYPLSGALVRDLSFLFLFWMFLFIRRACSRRVPLSLELCSRVMMMTLSK